jgi:hypothetical protein
MAAHPPHAPEPTTIASYCIIVVLTVLKVLGCWRC